MDLLRSISPVARTLAGAISQYHLTRKQYLTLTKGDLSDAVSELRKAGLLVPLRGRSTEGKEIPVYYYPPQLFKALKAVVPLMPSPSEDIKETIDDELAKIHYPDA